MCRAAGWKASFLWGYRTGMVLAPALLVLVMAAPAVAPGTHFKVVAFGDNDPLKDDASLIGATCIAEGQGLMRYSGLPYHYGIATCGDSPLLIDMLAVKIELASDAKPAGTPAATAKPIATKNAKPAKTPVLKGADKFTKLAPGTKFIVMEFGENDPLRDSTLVGETCVADGFLLKYKQSPFFYGQAKCGDQTVDLLAVRVQIFTE